MNRPVQSLPAPLRESAGIGDVNPATGWAGTSRSMIARRAFLPQKAGSRETVILTLCRLRSAIGKPQNGNRRKNPDLVIPPDLGELKGFGRCGVVAEAGRHGRALRATGQGIEARPSTGYAQSSPTARQDS